MPPPCLSTDFTSGSFRLAVNRKLEFPMPLDTIMVCARWSSDHPSTQSSTVVRQRFKPAAAKMIG